MRGGRWYELYPSVLGQAKSSLRFWVKTVEDGFWVKAERRWTGRIVAEAAHPQTWQEMHDPTHRRRILDEFMNKLLRANGDLPALNASDPAFQKLYPTLWAFLTCSAVRDENDQVVPRRTSTI